MARKALTKKQVAFHVGRGPHSTPSMLFYSFEKSLEGVTSNLLCVLKSSEMSEHVERLAQCEEGPLTS